MQPGARGNYRLQDLQIVARSVIPGLAGTVRPSHDFRPAASEFPTERIGRLVKRKKWTEEGPLGQAAGTTTGSN